MTAPGTFSIESVIIGHTARLRALFETVRIVSAGDSPVLITGETGTGKELTARVLHHWSRRRQGPFVPVTCAGRPELLEADLFGEELEAATTPSRHRHGRIEHAQGGTLYLDAVDEAPPWVQARLARMLEDGCIEPVGSSRTVPVDVRVIAASVRSPKALVAGGTVRADLFHRLNVFELAVPPLRERRADIPLLMRAFLERHAAGRGVEPPAVPAHVEQLFLRYDWPGNVRELDNACERMTQLCTCGTLGIGCIPPQVVFEGHAADAPALPGAVDPWIAAGGVSLDERLREVEASLIGWALRAAGGNKSRAAELLHIKRTTLADRISRHGAALLEAAGPEAASWPRTEPPK